MLGLGLSLGAVALRRPILVILPPGSGIAAPVIEQVSAAGASPFAWRVSDDVSFAPGFYWHVQRTAAADFAVLNGEAIQMIAPQDLAAGGGEIVFPDLSATPTGPLRLRMRVGREDGSGGYAWGPWSDTLTDMIAVSYTARFSAARKNQYAVLSNGDRTMRGTDLGSTYPTPAATNVALSAAIGYVEFVLLGGAKDYGPPVVGLVNGTYSFTGPSTIGQAAGSWCVRSDGAYYKGSAAFQGAVGATAVGQTIGLLVHKATGKVWVRTASQWYPEQPTFNADGSIATGTGIATDLTEFFFAVGSNDDRGWTVNAGQDAFAYTRPANVPAGWS